MRDVGLKVGGGGKERKVEKDIVEGDAKAVWECFNENSAAFKLRYVFVLLEVYVLICEGAEGLRLKPGLATCLLSPLVEHEHNQLAETMLLNIR